MKKTDVPKEYFDLTKKFVSFKSISPDPGFKKEVKEAGEWLRSVFDEHEFTTEFLISKKHPEANPVLLASYEKIPNAKTILVYGHYDVQPADISDGWETDPFELTEKGDRLVARGSIDNKGQVMVHISTIFKLIKEDRLKYNVKFLIEGNEETGSPQMADILTLYKDKFSADEILFSDGETQGNKPSMDVGFRGCVQLKITFTTAKNNLHSGIYGGAVPNAANELAIFLGKIYGEDNKVTIPGFYDDVDEISKEIREKHSAREDVEECKKLAGVEKLLCEKGYDFYTQVGLRPMLQVISVESGYTGDGFMNIIPKKAVAKINIRPVASQDPEKIINLVTNYFKDAAPEYVSVEVESDQSVGPSKIDVDTPFFKQVEEVLEEVYKDDVVYNFAGGTLPIVVDFQQILGIDPVSVSLASSDCNMHGVGENFLIPLLKKALKFSEEFFSQ